MGGYDQPLALLQRAMKIRHASMLFPLAPEHEAAAVASLDMACKKEGASFFQVPLALGGNVAETEFFDVFAKVLREAAAAEKAWVTVTCKTVASGSGKPGLAQMLASCNTLLDNNQTLTLESGNKLR